MTAYIKTDGVVEQDQARCIGKRGVGRCTNISPNYPHLPPYPEHPTWPYLCSDCANEPARKGSYNTRGIVEEKKA
jgi:hypothetical protein